MKTLAEHIANWKMNLVESRNAGELHAFIDDYHQDIEVAFNELLRLLDKGEKKHGNPAA